MILKVIYSSFVAQKSSSQGSTKMIFPNNLATFRNKRTLSAQTNVLTKNEYFCQKIELYHAFF